MEKMLKSILLAVACLVLLLVVFSSVGRTDERDVSGWTILGLDVPNYADGACRRIPRTERSWIRHYKIEVRWEKAQPTQERFEWNYYDRQIKAAVDDGARSILLLVGGPVPEWARDPKYGEFAKKAPPKNLGDWYRFCANLAERYGEVVDLYEIWNEPGWDRDAEAFRREKVFHFGGQVESDYVQLLRLAYAAIKKTDPSSWVISGALINSFIMDPEKGWELYGYMYGDYELSGKNVDLYISSGSTLSVRREVEFSFKNTDGMDGEPDHDRTESAKWVFLISDPGKEGKRTFLVLENPTDKATRVELVLRDEEGNISSLALVVASSSFSKVCIGAAGVGGYFSSTGCGVVEAFSEVPIQARIYECLRSEGSEADEIMVNNGMYFHLDEADERDIIGEEVLLYNPNELAVDAKIVFRNENAEEIRNTINISPGCCRRMIVERDIRYLYENALTPSERSLQIDADRPIFAKRYLAFSYPRSWRGYTECSGVTDPQSEHSIPVSAGDYSVKEFLVIKNETESEVNMNLEFYSSGVCFKNVSDSLPPSEARAFDLKIWLGLSGYCDMIAVHPYGFPETWGKYYRSLAERLRGLGVDKELVVTEIGWPNYADNNPQAYSEAQQAEALRTGLNGLRDAGCRKVWIYKVMDEPPGRSWDKTYFGLFKYDGTPHPAWEVYKEMQAKNRTARNYRLFNGQMRICGIL